jgi:hypothetical protein
VIEGFLCCNRDISEGSCSRAGKHIEKQRSLVKEIEIPVLLTIEIRAPFSAPDYGGTKTIPQILDIALRLPFGYLEMLCNVPDSYPIVILDSLVYEHDSFKLAHIQSIG